MGKHFNTAVRKAFASRMSELADFTEEKINKSIIGYPSERAYRMNSGNVVIWVSLITNPKGYNSFNIECGYSRRREYPSPSMRPSIFDLTPEVFSSESEGFFRLRTNDEEFDHAWSLSDSLSVCESNVSRLIDDLPKDEAEAMVKPLVDSAFETLKTRGIPVLLGIK